MMSDCRCDPHASGTNRCDFCKAEDRAACSVTANRLGSAVKLIAAIANGANPKRGGGPAPHVLCDRWLESNGYECEASRRRQRERRADDLDAEIARLRAERAKL